MTVKTITSCAATAFFAIDDARARLHLLQGINKSDDDNELASSLKIKLEAACSDAINKLVDSSSIAEQVKEMADAEIKRLMRMK